MKKTVFLLALLLAVTTAWSQQSFSPAGDQWSKEHFEIFTNPADGNLSIRTGTKLNEGKITIFNSKGEEVFTNPLDGHSLELSLPFQDGIYFVEITGPGFNKTQEIVLKK